MTYLRYPLIYGLFSATVVGIALVGGIAARHTLGFTGSEWFGYLVMLLASTFIFVGVKRYRDVEKGGVIRFLPALGLGVAIALVAAIVFATVWEAYLATTNYTFMDEMIAEQTRKLQASGASEAELASHIANFEWGRQVYANFFTRFGITMAEILMVGIPVALLSALALMFPKVFPAR
jgi:hypothetical protein